MTEHHPTYHLTPEFDKKLESFVKTVIADGFETFKEEFQRVDQFVKNARCDSSERTDHKLRQNPKEKYLLELIAFKVYDELNRQAFNNSENTLIIVPDCLSIHDQPCEKVEYPYGYICRKCQETCQAYQVVELAKKYGAKVLFSKRKLTEQLEYHASKMGDMGVIGIACIMMLAEGMRTANEVGIPARGVLLNFTGCDHWNDKPFASEFVMSTLTSILEEKYGVRD